METEGIVSRKLLRFEMVCLQLAYAANKRRTALPDIFRKGLNREKLVLVVWYATAIDKQKWDH